MADAPKSRKNLGISEPAASDAELRRLVTRIIKDSPKKRKDIAAEMSVRLARKVSESMLNDCTAEGKKAVRFPAAWIEAFCQVTDDDRLQLHVMGARNRRLIEFAKRELSARRDQRECEILRQELLEEDHR